MALIICSECGKDVSSKATACPSCGAPAEDFVDPTSRPKKLPIKVYAVSIALIIFVLWGFSVSTTHSNEPAKNNPDTNKRESPVVSVSPVASGPTPEQIEVQNQTCLTDLQCTGDKLTAEAETYCRRMLEDEAKAIAKWDYKIGDGGFFDFIIERLRWANESKQQIIFTGKKAKFQNGFSPWQRTGYSCFVDVATKRAISVWLDGQPMPDNVINALQSPEARPSQQEVQPLNTPAQLTERRPSFDCKLAKSPVENLIYADDDLSALDRELADLLAQAKQESADTQKLLFETRAAWNWREKNCRDKECLLTWYAERKNVYSTAIQEPDNRHSSANTP
jgi:hypothetical protein